MADEAEDPDRAAERLEAALERIARLAASRPAGDPATTASAAAPPANEDLREIVAGLDALITRLRSALAGRAE